MKYGLKKLTEINFNQIPLDNDLFMIGISGDRKNISYKDLLNDIETVYSNIHKINNEILLHIEDSYTFFVFMMSLLLAGKTIYIANNNKPLHIKDIITGCMTYITDGEISNLRNVTDSKIDLYNTSQFLDSKLSSGFSNKPDFLSKDGEINFFTSGSTGKPKLVKKTINQIELEVIELANEFGEHIKDSILVSTTLHYHFYGFIFALLLPFCLGIKTVRNKISYIETLNNIKGYSSITLISTPSFLKRIDKKSVKIYPKWNLFSSTGVLEKEVFDNCVDVFNTNTIEVYGSTETGALGYRCQNEGLYFKKLPSNTVGLSEIDEIIVSSPYTDNKDILMGDTGMLTDEHHFYLLGRNDSTVKVEGKRVNLKDIDIKIQQNKEFIDSYSIMYKSKSREQIVSFIVTKDINILNKTSKEKKDFVTDYLKNYFDDVLIPKKIVFIDSIPTNEIGKINRAKLESIIDYKSLFNEYSFNIISICDDELEGLISVPYESLYFDGHFEEFKALAGVLQVKMIFDIFKYAFKNDCPIKGIKKIKFMNIIKPDMKVLLNIKFNKSTHTILFKFYSKDKIFSKGDILLYE